MDFISFLKGGADKQRGGSVFLRHGTRNIPCQGGLNSYGKIIILIYI